MSDDAELKKEISSLKRELELARALHRFGAGASRLECDRWHTPVLEFKLFNWRIMVCDLRGLKKFWKGTRHDPKMIALAEQVKNDAAKKNDEGYRGDGVHK